eukprot:256826-Chlamydomonas_euryale.AAC.1
MHTSDSPCTPREFIGVSHSVTRGCHSCRSIVCKSIVSATQLSRMLTWNACWCPMPVPVQGPHAVCWFLTPVPVQGPPAVC